MLRGVNSTVGNAISVQKAIGYTYNSMFNTIIIYISMQRTFRIAARYSENGNPVLPRELSENT